MNRSHVGSEQCQSVPRPTFDTKQVWPKGYGGTGVGWFQVAHCTKCNSPGEAIPLEPIIRHENFALYERPSKQLTLVPV
jgi:hypothetical protein